MNYRVVRNDIAKMIADALVLPANSQLKEGPGASAALFEKAGRNKLKQACKEYINELRKKKRQLSAGMAVATLAYDLNADYIIHAVVPKWIDGKHDEYATLSAAYLSALELSDVMGCKSIAFPLLASGNNGFELELAFEIAKESIEAYQPINKLELVILVVYGFQITKVLSKYNVDVEEIIDQKYVFSKAEASKPRAARLFEEAAVFVGGVAEKGLDQAEIFLSDEKNQYRVLDKGKAIAYQVLKSTITETVGKNISRAIKAKLGI